MFLRVIFYFTRASLKKPNIQDITLEERNRNSGFIICENIVLMFLPSLFSGAFDLINILISVRSGTFLPTIHMYR